jgi:hypothetical protein
MVELVMRRRFFALMLSIPLVASGAAGVALHVCDAMGGVLVGDCGCDTQPRHGTQGSHAGHAGHAAKDAPVQLRTQPCCTVKLSSASQLVATQEVSSQQVDEAAVAVVASASASVASSRELCDPGLVRERAPPNVHGPPLFIRNCSFLN